MKILQRAVVVLCLLLLGTVAGPVYAVNNTASKLTKPESQVLLTFSGNISHFNLDQPQSGQRSAALDLAMLEARMARRFSTKTPWTKGDTEFEGVLLSDLLALVGARSNHLTLTGLDGYSADINTVDFDRYPIIVAYKRDSEYMSVRSLGPLWLMFPFDQHPELVNEANKAASVWQLVSVVVH